MSAPLAPSNSSAPSAAPTAKPSFLMNKKIGGASFGASPTDNMMSPCSQKLVQSKKRHYMKGKPLSLSASFAAAKGPGPSGLGPQAGEKAGSENQKPL